MLPVARDPLERRPGLRERKDRVDLRAKLACVRERSQLHQLFAVGLDDEVDRTGRLLCDRDRALAGGDLAAAGVEDEIGRTTLDNRCTDVSRKLDGKTLSLSRLRGRPIVVHYWATWCEPCKQDLKLLRQLQARYQKLGLQLVGVSVDGRKEDALAFVK